MDWKDYVAIAVMVVLIVAGLALEGWVDRVNERLKRLEEKS